MNKINLPQASKLTSPNPVTLVCTQRPDGGTNLATVSWWTYLSFNQNMIAYAMAKTSYSGERVRETKKVILTIPSEEIANEVMKCGMSTGRTTDKAKEYGIALQEIPDSDIQIPLHSKVAIKCSLREFIETGDHYLYICNVEDVYANTDKKAVFAWNGYSEIRTAE
ncbi:MAG: flavin reductase family protein [Lachnospiraceae bacterium]|nr:flavin reductase family protein [Lachnospiraceae bacterium]